MTIDSCPHLRRNYLLCFISYTLHVVWLYFYIFIFLCFIDKPVCPLSFRICCVVCSNSTLRSCLFENKKKDFVFIKIIIRDYQNSLPEPFAELSKAKYFAIIRILNVSQRKNRIKIGTVYLYFTDVMHTFRQGCIIWSVSWVLFNTI